MQAENIVVAWDFSDSSEAALLLATSFARDMAATLHIVHVKVPFAVYRLDSRYGEVPLYPELETLEKTLKEVVPADTAVAYRHWLCASDDVAKEIVRVARELDADFIMMGTHGRTGLPRLLVGSVAESVIRHADCPVLTIKQPQLAMVEPTLGVLPS